MNLNPKWIVGKTVKKVITSDCTDVVGEKCKSINTIFFTDGSSIRLISQESESLENHVVAVYNKGTK